MEIAHLLPLLYSKLFIYTLAFTRIAAFLNAFILFRRWVVAQRPSSASQHYSLSMRSCSLVRWTEQRSRLRTDLFTDDSAKFVRLYCGHYSQYYLLKSFQPPVKLFRRRLVWAWLPCSIHVSVPSPISPIFTWLPPAYVFFALNGHIFMMKEILESFQTMPLDQLLISKHMLYSVLQYSERIFSSSVLGLDGAHFTILIVKSRSCLCHKICFAV